MNAAIIFPDIETPVQLDRQLLEAIPTAVCVYEALTGRVLFYNQRALELWGSENGPFRMYRPDGLPDIFDGRSAASKSKGEELIIERPDGSRFSVLLHVSPLENEAGATQVMVACFQDISRFTHS